MVASDESRYRPEVGTRGMIVSDDRIASEYGAKILREGGNAIDAAVATAFALSVTRPHYASLGGGGFLVYCPAASKEKGTPASTRPACLTIDYREEAPAAATRDMYVTKATRGKDLSRNGALASGVPGVPAGLLLALEKYGTMSRQKVLSHPIRLAREGYRFTGNSEKAARARWDVMNAEAKRIFGCGKGPCPPGETVRQPDLARTLEAISRKGKAGFYQGEVARKLARGIQQGGGVITEQDLARYQAKLRLPVTGNYRGMEVVSMPPPSAGGVVLLQMLGYAERADQQRAFEQGFGSARSLHALTHAMSLGFADRAYYFGDPEFARVPVEKLLSPDYLDRRWKSYDSGDAEIPAGQGEIAVGGMRTEVAGRVGSLASPVASSEAGLHTTHFSVIDRHGGAVAITTTVNDNFGSGFVPPGTGVVMNNEMDDFSIEPGVPNMFGLVGAEANSIAPGKRPLSSMTPTIVRDRNGEVRLVLGAQGGPRITTSVFLALVNRLRFGMSLPDAVTAPRFHHQWKPADLFLEKHGFSPEVLSRLRDMGYSVQEKTDLARMQTLERLPDGRVWGFSDPRTEGAAVAE